jgi:hypothetical protein
MNDAERYQKELNTILQELEAKERLREQQRAKDLQDARKALEPIVNDLAKALGWTEEYKRRKLEDLFQFSTGQKD